MSDPEKCPMCGTSPAFWFWVGVVSFPAVGVGIYVLLHISIGWKGG